MPRQFDSKRTILGLAVFAFVLALIGMVAGYIGRATDRDRLMEQSRQLDAFDKRLDAIAKEMDELKVDLQDQIRRMSQRPPRGKIEETYDKFDAPVVTPE